MAARGNTAALSLSHTHSSSSSEDDASGHRLTPLALPPTAAAATIPEKAAITRELGSSTTTKKKPRGRPPGSKNKPKSPVVVVVAAQDSSGSSSSAMRPVVLEISAGSNVVDALTSFALRRRMGLAVLSGSGSVSEVTLRHPLPHAPPLSLRGPFNLLSLSGSALGGCINDKNDGNESKDDRPAKQLCRQEGSSHFGITLAGAQGQVFGGVVGGKVVAATPVVVVAATFVSPSVHRFPSGGDEEGGDHQETKPCIGGGGGGGGGGSEPPSCPSSAAVAGGLYCGGGGLSGQATSPELMPWGGAANSASRPPY